MKKIETHFTVKEKYAYADMSEKPMNKPEQEKESKQVQFTQLPDEHLVLLRASRFEHEVKRKRRRSKEVVRQWR
jgi:hypothetical protein